MAKSVKEPFDSAANDFVVPSLSSQQIDANNARWSMGIFEDDNRPYLIVSGIDSLGLPRRSLIPVEGEIENIQIKAWEFLDRLPKKSGKIECTLTVIGPRDSRYSSCSPVFGDDARILNILKDIVLGPVYNGCKFSTAAYEARLT